MEIRMDDRVVVVTGGSRNIGEAAVRLFAEAGARLVVCARNEDELAASADRIRKATGAEILDVPADLSTPEGVTKVADTALDHFGGVDVFVHNAFYNAVRVDSEMLGLTARQWQLYFAVNVIAPYELARRLAPSLRERGHGSIVTLLSTACFDVLPPYIGYGASKGALWQVTRYLAAELAPGVRVNAVCPGTTPAHVDDARTDWSSLLSKVPLARTGDAMDSAKAILYLASDAASYTTGQVIFTDGGRVSVGTGSSA